MLQARYREAIEAGREALQGFPSVGAAAVAAMPSERRPYWGTTLLNYRVRRIEQALGRGDDAQARVELDGAARGALDSTGPQFLAPLGAHRAELERRAGNAAAARAAIDEALDRIEFCSEDVARIAQVAAAGVRVEADEAERARDRRDEAGEAEARERAAAMADRVQMAAYDGGPVVEAQVALAQAELARAEGRREPALWETGAAAWEDLGRPYPAAYSRWREAEVLELVAAGATNREIGERLHMAEKTASVHVSRILAKLDVRSRTEAAAVAHRHGLTDAEAVV